MAARRLIVVLVVLFGISIAAAAIAPRPETSTPAEDETSPSTSSAPAGPLQGGGIVAETIGASSEEPETVRVAVGDQLALTVASEAFLEVEIADLGLLESATPGAPARFDLLLRDPGDLEITDGEDGEIVGRLLIERRTGDQ